MGQLNAPKINPEQLLDVFASSLEKSGAILEEIIEAKAKAASPEEASKIVNEMVANKLKSAVMETNDSLEKLSQAI
jgi:hypothetical protein